MAPNPALVRILHHSFESRHPFPVATNQLNRQFTVARPESGVGRRPFIWTIEGWLYLAVLLGHYSRTVMGCALGHHLTGELTQQVLVMAIRRRQPKPDLLHYSDRGSAGITYQQQLRAADMTGSMSRRGNCWEYACVKSLFGTVKRELMHHRQYGTREEATREICEEVRTYLKIVDGLPIHLYKSRHAPAA